MFVLRAAVGCAACVLQEAAAHRVVEIVFGVGSSEGGLEEGGEGEEKCGYYSRG